MAQRQFRSDDTSTWTDRYGTGSNGSLSQNTATDTTANTTLTGTSGGTSATAGSGTGFAAGNLVVIHQTQGTGFSTWELNKISSVGSGTNWTMGYTLINTYGTGAQVYLLKQYTTATINSAQTLTCLAWNGSKGGIYALLADSSITVTGNIVVTGKGFGGGANGLNQGIQGDSGTGAGGASTAANGAAGGGGIATTNWGGGGGGGNGAVGSDTTVALDRGFGGGTSGAANLVTMELGAGGGGAARDTGGTGGAGGTGGGIVILIAPTITITGTVALTGNNGANGTAPKIGGGGGGAGGSLLIKGATIVLGSNLATALAGSGGSANGQGDTGGAGGVGRIHADYATSITGTTNPTIDTRQDTSLTPSGSAMFFSYF